MYFGEESQDETRDENDNNRREYEKHNSIQNGADRGGSDGSG